METKTEVVTFTTIEGALSLLDQWIAAHEALLRECERLEMRCEKAEGERDYLKTLRRHLDPFLPPNMQQPHWVRENPKAYAAIAEHLEEEKVPF